MEYFLNSNDKIEKNLDSISRNIYDIANTLKVTAIIVIGPLNLKLPKIKNVPILYTTSNFGTIIDKLISLNENEFKYNVLNNNHENVNKRSIDDTLNQSLLQSIIPIEYSIENIIDGLIICVSKSETSLSIILQDINSNPIIQTLKNGKNRLDKHVLSSVLKLSLDLAIIGREGKRTGTAFIIGDSENVINRSHQMIINPYKAQELKDKDILRRENWESIMNFAQLDGVFVVSSSGEILAAGRYLDVDAHNLKIEKGLGSRHISAASITRDTKAIAIIISESGGTIRLYMDGKEVFSINPYTASIIFNKKIII